MRAYLTIAVDKERLDRPALVHVINARNKGGDLCPWLSNPNLLRLARCTRSADVDVVAAGREVDPCVDPKAIFEEPVVLFASASNPSAELS